MTAYNTVCKSINISRPKTNKISKTHGIKYEDILSAKIADAFWTYFNRSLTSAIDLSNLATHTDVSAAVVSIKGSGDKSNTDLYNHSPTVTVPTAQEIAAAVMNEVI